MRRLAVSVEWGMFSIIAVVLLAGATRAAEAAALATKTITVTHEDPGGGPNPDFQGITCDGKISVVEGDSIEVAVDGNVWCPTSGNDTGTVTVSVASNVCGFTSGDLQIHETTGGGKTQAVAGAATANVGDFPIDITYVDSDCGGSAPGANSCQVWVNCNGPAKGACCLGPTQTEITTASQCEALGGAYCGDGSTECLKCVPTMSEWGLIALCLILLAAGTIVMRRRMATA